MHANGRIQASYAIARVAGPSCAGVLLAVLSLPQLLWFDAASFLVSAGSLLVVRSASILRRLGDHPRCRVLRKSSLPQPHARPSGKTSAKASAPSWSIPSYGLSRRSCSSSISSCPPCRHSWCSSPPRCSVPARRRSAFSMLVRRSASTVRKAARECPGWWRGAAPAAGLSVAIERRSRHARHRGAGVVGG